MVLRDSELRDLIIRAHGMATAHYVQSDAEMRRRIGAMLGKAIQSDETMRTFLGHTDGHVATPGTLTRRDSST